MWWGVLVASAGAVCSGVATVMMALDRARGADAATAEPAR
jgi:hypothetical protein